MLFGMNGHDIWYIPQANWQANVDMLANMGVKVYRQDFYQGATFSGNGVSWATSGTTISQACVDLFSAFAAKLVAAGIQPLFVFGGNGANPPSNYSDFASQLAQLCAAVPGLWIEIGNEIELSFQWNAGNGGITAAEYVSLLSDCVTACHNADPTCMIGPSPVANINSGGGGYNWMTSLFGANLTSVDYDFLPFHLYGSWGSNGTDPPPNDNFGGSYSTNTLASFWTGYCTGKGNTKPYFMTECGFQSTDASSTPNMNEALQAAYATGYNGSSAGYTGQPFLTAPDVIDLPVVLWYDLIDDTSSGYGSSGSQTYGIFTYPSDSSGEAEAANEKTVYTALVDEFGGSQSPTVSTTSLPNGTEGTAYSQTLAESGGTGPFTWSVMAGELPAGLTLSSGGVLSGTPTAVGTFNFLANVEGASSHAAVQRLSLSVVAASGNPSITTGSPLPSGTVGVSYSETIAATGGTTPYSWSISAGALPAGLSIGATSGVISGIPSAAGSFSFTVEVTDANAKTATAQFSVAIASPSPVVPRFVANTSGQRLRVVS